MKRYSKRENQGFTIIELVISMAMLCLIIILSGSMLLFGQKVMTLSENEYKFQFSTRMTLQSTSDIIRYSSALFTIPKSSFSANSYNNFAAGWDYIGVREVTLPSGETGNEVVKCVYDDTAKTHVSTVLLEADPDVVYQFVFTKVNPSNQDSLLQFSIKSYPVGSLDEYGKPRAAITITSEVEARNSLQLIDLSSNSTTDPAIAIAFKTQNRVKNVVGDIAMVLDTSGSMADNLSGSYGGKSRISILREEATTLINKFAQEDNINISLVPFATSANNPNSYLNAKTNTTQLISEITSLTAIGGTNTGDGLRRAYLGLEAQNAAAGIGVTSSNYVIVLVDGVTTFGSVVSAYNRTYLTGGGNVNEGYLDRNDPYNPNGQIVGNGSTLDSKGTAYVNLIGAMLKEPFSKVYVIGFSSISSELNSVDNIAAACGITAQNYSSRVFRASSATALTQVFDQIRQDIVNDLWYLQGPAL